MPFPPDVAYRSFSNFSRHTEWNPSVKSVEYIDGSAKTKARWTMETKLGFDVSWVTIPTTLQRNKAIAWKSIEGLKLEGKVSFQPVNEGRGTLMILSSTYSGVPEKSSMTASSNKVKGKIINKVGSGSKVAPLPTTQSCRESQILEKFCEVVSKEEKTKETTNNDRLIHRGLV